MRLHPSSVLLLLCWAVLSAVSIWSRPLLPIDETRYANVAWEMYSSGDWLVPRVHGEPYSHKPPLLFWLISLGWTLLGEYPWVARLVGALIVLADLFLLAAVARRLWPDDARTATLAPWVFYSSLAVALFSTTLMFDLLMTSAVLLAVLGLLESRERRRGWLLFALGMGLGLLAKGPAVFLYLLPVALAAPWWRASRAGNGYGYLFVSLLLGVALALCWAIPAVLRGGETYRDMLLWGQTAGRMTSAFAHDRPWWWYLPLLPLLLLPWTLWPALWRALYGLLRQAAGAERFCLVWLGAGLLGFSLVSGKQVHYLLPLLPAWALLASRAIGQLPVARPGRATCALLALPWLLTGLVLAIWPLLGDRPQIPEWLQQLSPWAGGALVLLVLIWIVPVRRSSTALGLATLPLAFLMLLHIVVLRPIAPGFALRPLHHTLTEAQLDGRPVALAAHFRDQYPFSLPLARPVTLLGEGEEITWAQRHPEGLVVINHKRLDSAQKQAAQGYQAMRSGYSVIWLASALQDRPGLLLGELPVEASSAPE